MPQLKEDLSKATTIIANIMGTVGLKLNYGSGNTEALILWRCPGCRKTKRELIDTGTGKASITVETMHGAKNLALVPTYKHLGVRITADGCIKPELRQRSGQAYQTIRDLKPLLTKSGLKSKTKMNLVMCYAGSKLLFGAAAWPDLTPAELSTVRKPLAHAARLINAGYKSDGKPAFNDDIAMEMAGFEPIEDMIATIRYGHIRNIFLYTSPSTVSTYASDPGFSERLCRDMQRLFDHSNRVVGVISNSSKVECVQSMTKEQWKTFVKKAVAESKQDRSKRARQASRRSRSRDR